MSYDRGSCPQPKYIESEPEVLPNAPTNGNIPRTIGMTTGGVVQTPTEHGESHTFQGFPVPVGDEAVIAAGGEEGQLGTGRGLHPPDDEPHRRGVGLALEGSAELVPISEGE